MMAVTTAATVVALREEPARRRSSLFSMAEWDACVRNARSKAAMATAVAHWASWAVPWLREAQMAVLMVEPWPKGVEKSWGAHLLGR